MRPHLANRSRSWNTAGGKRRKNKKVFNDQSFFAGEFFLILWPERRNYHLVTNLKLCDCAGISLAVVVPGATILCRQKREFSCEYFFFFSTPYAEPQLFPLISLVLIETIFHGK